MAVGEKNVKKWKNIIFMTLNCPNSMPYAPCPMLSAISYVDREIHCLLGGYFF